MNSSARIMHWCRPQIYKMCNKVLGIHENQLYFFVEWVSSWQSVVCYRDSNWTGELWRINRPFHFWNDAFHSRPSPVLIFTSNTWWKTLLLVVGRAMADHWPLMIVTSVLCLQLSVMTDKQTKIQSHSHSRISDAHTAVQYNASLDFIGSLIIRPTGLVILAIQKPTQFSFTFFIFV